MPKFFAPDCDLREAHITLRGKHAEHLRVLRVREGEELIVSDGRGTEARCAVEAADKAGCLLRVLELRPMTGEPTVSAVLYAALPKGDKTEVIVQKAVELGAEGIVFFQSSRCVARPEEKALRGKLERLQKIAEGAAMQSGRGRIPWVRWIPRFPEMLGEASRAGLAAFLWEEETSLSLRALMKSRQPFTSAALITGPEGGFSAEEAEAAKAAGIPAVTLGTRILRCETAPLCALTAVMYETGNLDG
jgi:16S rRNA (uracil1498-N3)-methyltransferase